MALISCPECRTETSTLGEACTKCGCPVAKMILPNLAPATPVSSPDAKSPALPVAGVSMDARIRAALRWMLYLPAGAFLGSLTPTVAMVIGGWLLGDWRIPSVGIVFTGYFMMPYGMVAIALNTAPIDSDAGAAAVKWIMVGVASLLTLGTFLVWYGGDYGSVGHLQEIFGSLSPKVCATTALCGLAVGLLGSIATDPEDML